MRLKDKVCLITGGAAGIGKATAQRFVQEGAIVVICDLAVEAGEATAAELGGQSSFYKVNVADRTDVQNWVDQVVVRYGRVDVLINNAGITRDAMFVKVKDGVLVKQMEEQAFDLVVDVNLKGAFNCIKSACRPMMKQRSGRIVNMPLALAACSCQHSPGPGFKSPVSYSLAQPGLWYHLTPQEVLQSLCLRKSPPGGLAAC